MTRTVVEGIERLDGALKHEAGVEEVRPLVQQLTQSIQGVAALVDSMAEIR